VAGEELPADLAQIVRDEVNVKDLVFAVILPTGEGWVSGSGEVPQLAALQTTLSEQLVREGLAREIIRYGQALRREADFTLDARITLLLVTEAVEVQHAFDEHREDILRTLQADTVVTDGVAAAEREVRLSGQSVRLGVIQNTEKNL
jgi:hypothetical protein